MLSYFWKVETPYVFFLLYTYVACIVSTAMSYSDLIAIHHHFIVLVE